MGCTYVILPLLTCMHILPKKGLKGRRGKSVESTLCPSISPYDNFGWGCCNIQMGVPELLEENAAPFSYPHQIINFPSQRKQTPIFHITNIIFRACFDGCFARVCLGITELTALKETSKCTSKYFSCTI